MRNLKIVSTCTLLILFSLLTGCAVAYKRPFSYYNQTQTSNASNNNYSSPSLANNLTYDAEHPVATAAEASVESQVIWTQYLRYQRNKAIRAIESRTGSY